MVVRDVFAGILCESAITSFPNYWIILSQNLNEEPVPQLRSGEWIKREQVETQRTMPYAEGKDLLAGFSGDRAMPVRKRDMFLQRII